MLRNRRYTVRRPSAVSFFLQTIIICVAISLVTGIEAPIQIFTDYNGAPSDARAQVGEAAHLTCRISRKFSWLYHRLDFFRCDGMGDDLESCRLIASGPYPIDPSKYSVNVEDTEQPSFQLQIADTQPTDEGFYRCALISGRTSALNSNRTLAIAKIKLIVRQTMTSVKFINSTNVHLVGDKIMLVEYGKESTIICEVIGGYPRPTIEVYYNGGILKNPMPSVVKKIDGLPVFRVTHEKFRIDDRDSDNKEIFCRANIDDPNDETAQSDTRRLQVSHAPHIVSCGTIDNPVVGRPSTLACTVIASDPIRHASWNAAHLNTILPADGSSASRGLTARLENKKNFGFESSGAPMYGVRLEIDNVTMEHSGNFTLEVSNHLGNHTYQYQFKPRLSVNEPPNVASYSSRNGGSCNQPMSLQILLLTVLALSLTVVPSMHAHALDTAT